MTDVLQLFGGKSAIARRLKMPRCQVLRAATAVAVAFSTNPNRRILDK